MVPTRRKLSGRGIFLDPEVDQYVCDPQLGDFKTAKITIKCLQIGETTHSSVELTLRADRDEIKLLDAYVDANPGVLQHVTFVLGGTMQTLLCSVFKKAKAEKKVLVAVVFHEKATKDTVSHHIIHIKLK